MEPELENQRPISGESQFKSVDAVERLLELGVWRFAIHPLEKRAGVPRAKKDGQLAFGRQRTPEAPEVRPLALLIAEWPEGVGLEIAWIHPLVERIDGLAFARTINATNDHNHRKLLLLVKLVLDTEQVAAQLWQ